jgi:hypothetical protein
MASDGLGLSASRPFRFSQGQRRPSHWRYAALAMVGVVAIVLLFDGHVGRVDDFQRRACLEPVYAGLFGTGPGTLERCIARRPQLFGARDAAWLRYVRHLEASCPVSIGMQGQAICEFQVKASEDRAGKGWRSGRY